MLMGVDYTPLKGEYSYKNGESMASLTLRSGTQRYFFFFNDSLWKIYDEHKLKEGGTLGANFDEAVKALTKRFGAPPKLTKADPKKGPAMNEAEWRDPDKVIRAVDRGETLAMIYSERRIYENLANYRKNKIQDVRALDAEVVNVTKKEEPAVEPEGQGQRQGQEERSEPRGLPWRLGLACSSERGSSRCTSSVDALGGVGHQDAAGDHDLGAGRDGAQRGLDHAPPRHRVSRATRVATGEVQGDAVVVHAHDVHFTAVGADERREQVANDSDQGVARGRHDLQPSAWWPK